MAIPEKPTLTPLPPAPQRTDTPTAFADKADPFVAALDPYRQQLVAAINWQEAVFEATEGEATAAAQARQGAQSAQSSAVGARNKAEAWADEMEDVQVETGKFSARHHAAKARGYHDSAEVAAAAAQAGAGLPSLEGNGRRPLIVKADESGVEWGDALQTGYTEFTSSGSFTPDPSSSWVYVEAIGGGGGGLNAAAPNSGTGGAGGHYAARLFRVADLAASVSVVVGAGGVGARNPTGGGDSQFAALVAPGGIDGKSQAESLGGLPGYASGAGGDEYGLHARGGDSVMGGGGGGARTSPGGASANAGDGGAGSLTGVAGDGQFPGGGGGGTQGNTAGDGADGVVRVWEW
ncbi:glycine-rich domain-containing protein [Halomonas organivorans]|uniref:Glycine-rich domain-containing protein n=1 Tax=Halomonas organivorans TaxID=257772 RepID=A0A7W5BZV5_9GAMM|nr:hypothetical protein [Halomonas organivorans]MBB3142184.1 hypothetical protein [Halomonas organivorans]